MLISLPGAVPGSMKTQPERPTGKRTLRFFKAVSVDNDPLDFRDHLELRHVFSGAKRLF
jgi:hypothetical protein